MPLTGQMRVRPGLASLLVGFLVLIVPSVALAQQPAAAESEELAKKLANPISDLVSVPLQFNWEQKVGPLELTRFILNVQPVMPFELNPHWNLIARVIMPFVSQPPLVADGVAVGGISDITTSFFFSPRGKGKLTVGFGPAIVLPSTSEPTLGSGRWSLGPTIVALEQDGPWTYGVLWNQVWSIAGDAARPDVDQMFLQPFLAYQATRTVTLTLQSETVGNWEAEEGQKWTVPINVLVSKLSTFGVFPASYMFGVGGFVAHPDAGPSWKIRAAIVILLPKRK